MLFKRLFHQKNQRTRRAFKGSADTILLRRTKIVALHKKVRYAAPQHRVFSNFQTHEEYTMFEKQALASFEEFVAPSIALNKIALSYTEKMVELNLAVMRKQADLVLASWNQALGIKDAEAAKQYMTSQSEVVRSAVEDYVADAKTVSELNKEVAADVRKVVEQSISKAAKQTA
jgi:phasin family protein